MPSWVEASLTLRAYSDRADGGKMHISSTAPAIAAPQSSPGKSNAVPPGLANRNLSLPPGIAKKLAAGGIPPAGIAKRFPAALKRRPQRRARAAQRPLQMVRHKTALSRSIFLSDSKPAYAKIKFVPHGGNSVVLDADIPPSVDKRGHLATREQR